ncbi:MAG: hypothetical protein WDO13_09105 [Verrucomicrobiota bacterium]
MAKLVCARPLTRTGFGKFISHKAVSSACTPMSMHGPPPLSFGSMKPGLVGSQLRRVALTRA